MKSPLTIILFALLCVTPACASTRKKPVTTRRAAAAKKQHSASARQPVKSSRSKARPTHKPALIKQTVIVHGRRVTRYVPAKPIPAPPTTTRHPHYTPPQLPDPLTTPAPPPPTALADEPAQAFLYPGQLAPFFKSLAELPPAGTQDPLTTYPGQSGTVRILQFGDSHTAADLFTGAVRAQMQARFGNGGLGFQYPGHPFAGYHLAGSSRSQSEGWYTQGNKFTQLGSGDLGLGGISLTTHRAGEYTLLSTTCTTFQVEFLRQASGRSPALRG